MSFDHENPAESMQGGFHDLRALNEIVLFPAMGLQPRIHLSDAESVTHVQDGALIHQDRTGSLRRLETGEFRRTSDYRGAPRRTINASPFHSARIVQILVRPDSGRHKRDGEQKRFPASERKGILRLIASPDGRDASLSISADVRIYSSLLDSGTHLVHDLRPDRSAWLQVMTGRINLIHRDLHQGDGAALQDEVAVSLTAHAASEILLFDLA